MQPSSFWNAQALDRAMHPKQWRLEQTTTRCQSLAGEELKSHSSRDYAGTSSTTGLERHKAWQAAD
jgi:hypothetical protein